jgi:hypothetical protein
MVGGSGLQLPNSQIIQFPNSSLELPLPEVDSSIEQLLALLDESFDHAAWHGPTLRGSLRGVTELEAAWRPAPRHHNIWELTVHATYWAYAVHRGITRSERGGYGEKGSNWFVRPAPGHAWPRDVRRLVEQHRQLRASIATLSRRDLRRVVRGRPLAHVIRGIAAHNLYHAGQIQLLKRLQEELGNREIGKSGN